MGSIKAQARAVLRSAAARIRDRGWTRHDYFKHGRACILGSMGYGSNVSPSDATRAAVQMIVVELDLSGYAGSVSGWNDRQQTRQPVLALLDKLGAE